MTQATLQTVKVDELTLAYRELGEGPPVLLLHGWPTSSYLWRDVMVPIARANRVIALDLPGFGASSKPPGAAYTFGFFARALDGFVEALGIEAHGLAVHDLGGPVGVHWALQRPGRVTHLALLNTLLFPDFSPAVLQFIDACTKPESRAWLTGPEGLEAAMRLGVADESRLTDEVIEAVREPFAADAARAALADAGIGLELDGFAEIERRLGELAAIPVRVVYGEQDRILPEIADTVARVQRALPAAAVTALPDAGHFLQEDAPQEIGELLAEFFAP